MNPEEKLSEKVKAMKPSGIRKFFDVVNTMPGAISLGVGEPDFDTPLHIREVGINSLIEGKTFYTSNSGLLELRQAIAEKFEKDTSLSYDPKTEIEITVGGSEAIDDAFRALVNPGDEVICPEPCYVSYTACISLAGGVPVTVPLKQENNFVPTPEMLEKACTEKSKVLILSYPNNPTGAVMRKADLEKLVPVIEKHDLVVISDEIYSALTYGDEKHTCLAALPGMRDRTITISGFSKAYAMTGWRLGYAIGNAAFIKQMTKIHQFCIMCAPTMSQYAAIEAVKNGDADIEMMRQSYDERRKYLYKTLNDMGLKCFEPMGAFYIFPDISGLGMTSDEFCNRLLEEEKLAVVPGTAFGDCGEGNVRISYAYSMDELKVAMGRLESFVKRHSK